MTQERVNQRVECADGRLVFVSQDDFSIDMQVDGETLMVLEGENLVALSHFLNEALAYDPEEDEE